MVSDKEFIELMRDMHYANQEAKMNEQRRAQEEFVRLTSGNTFFVELYYLDGKFEEVEMEGYTNASNLLDTYKEMGHSLKLRKLVLGGENGKIRAWNFKYNNNREKM